MNIPQINLPQVNLSQLNIPNTIQSIASVPTTILMPAGVAIGATSAAIPKIQETIQQRVNIPQLQLPDIPQAISSTLLNTRLFPASAASCSGCPSPQTLMIANDIDPSKYTMPQQLSTPIASPNILSGGISNAQTIYASNIAGAMGSALDKFLGIDSSKSDLFTSAKQYAIAPVKEGIGIVSSLYDAAQVTISPQSGKILQQQQQAAISAEELKTQYNAAWESAKHDGYVKNIDGIDKFVIPQGDIVAQKRFDDISTLANQANIKASESLELGKAYEKAASEEESKSFMGLYEGAEKYVGDTYTKKVFPTMYAPGEILLKNIADPLVGKQMEIATGLLPSEHLQATLGGGLVKYTTTPSGDIIRTEYGMDVDKSLFDIPRKYGGKLIDTTIKEPYLNVAAKKAGAFLLSIEGAAAGGAFGGISPFAATAPAISVLGNIPYSIELEATRGAFESPRDRPILTTAMFALPGAMELAEYGGAATFAAAAARGGRIGQAGRLLSSPLAKHGWEVAKGAVGAYYIADLPQRISGYGITGGDLSKGEVIKFTPIPGVDTSNVAIGKRLGSVYGSEIVPLLAGAGVVSLARNPQQVSQLAQSIRSRVPQRLQNAWIDLNYRVVEPTPMGAQAAGTPRRGFMEVMGDSYRRSADVINNRLWRATSGVTSEPHGTFRGTTIDITPTTSTPATPTGGAQATTNTFGSYFRSMQETARSSMRISPSSRLPQTSTISSDAAVLGENVPRITSGRQPVALLPEGQTTALTVRQAGPVVAYERPGVPTVYETVKVDARGVPMREGTGVYRITTGADGKPQFIEVMKIATEKSPVVTSSKPTRWSESTTQELTGRGAKAQVKATRDVTTPRSSITESMTADVNTLYTRDAFVDWEGRGYLAESAHRQNVINYNARSNLATIDHEVVSVPLQYRGADISKLPVRESVGTFSSNNPYGASSGTQVRIYDSVRPDGTVARRVMIWQDVRTGSPRLLAPEVSGGSPQQSFARAMDKMIYQQGEMVEGVDPFGNRYTPEIRTTTIERTMRTSPQVVVEYETPSRVSTSGARVIETPRGILPDDTTKSLVVMRQASNTPSIFKIDNMRFTASEGGSVVGRTNVGVVSRRSIFNPSTNEVYTMTTDGTVIITDALSGRYVGSYKSVPNDNINAVFEQMLTDPGSVNPHNLEYVVGKVRVNSGIEGITGGKSPRTTSRTPTTRQPISTTARSGAGQVVVEEGISEIQNKKANDFLKKTSEFFESTSKSKPQGGQSTTGKTQYGTRKTYRPQDVQQPRLTSENLRVAETLSKDYETYTSNTLNKVARALKKNIDAVSERGTVSFTPTDIRMIELNMIGLMVINGILKARGGTPYPIIPPSEPDYTPEPQSASQTSGSGRASIFSGVFERLFDNIVFTGDPSKIEDKLTPMYIPKTTDRLLGGKVYFTLPSDITTPAGGEDKRKITPPFSIKTPEKDDDSSVWDIVTPIIIRTPTDDSSIRQDDGTIRTPIDDSSMRQDDDTIRTPITDYPPPPTGELIVT